MRAWAGAGQPGRAAAAGLDGAGGADAPDADAVPELLPAVRADSADTLAHARAGWYLVPWSWSKQHAVLSLPVKLAQAWPAPVLLMLGLQHWLPLVVLLLAGAAAGAPPAAAPAPNGPPKHQLTSPQPPALTLIWPGDRSSACSSSSNASAVACPTAHAAASTAAAAALAAVSHALLSHVWIISASSSSRTCSALCSSAGRSYSSITYHWKQEVA